MQIKTLVCLMAAMAMLPAAAQVLAAAPTPNTACIQFNQTIVTKLDSGQIAEAEALLSAELKEQDGHLEPSCLGLTLHNFANVLALSGRLAEAEAVAQKSLRLNAVTYAQEDSRLFRPLHLLWSIQFQRGERGKARQTFHKMQALLLDRAQDRSMFHGATATQLQADGSYEEAGREFIKALAASEEKGRAQTVDFAILLSGLGALQLERPRAK